MASFKLDPIFRGGITSGALRAFESFLAEQEDRFDRYVIPAAGNMTAAQGIADHGIDPDKIHCSDISIYTSVLGYVCDPEKNVSDLGFQVLEPVLLALLIKGPTIECSEDVREGARILYAIKWCQLQGTTTYIEHLRKEVELGAGLILNAYAATLTELHTKLKGMHYEMRDAHPHMTEARDEEKTLIIYGPPGYGGGYSKMFASHGAFTWNEPAIPELVIKDIGPFIGGLVDAKATAMIFATEGHAIDDRPEGSWASIYVELNSKTMMRTYLLSNKASDVLVAKRRKFQVTPANVPAVYDDHEITEDCEISFVKTTLDMSLYFYDLFVRDLGMVKAEAYYLFCLDGQVAGACGFDVRTYLTTRQPRLYETFGLSITSEKYARMGRLLMAALCSQQFVTQFTQEHCAKDLLLPPIQEIQTTCLTKYHEAKKNRGILKLIKREKMPNGRFHLIYRTPVHQTTFKEVVAAWLKKHAKYGRVSQGGTTV